MQKIRRATKKHRTLLLIIVAMLALGVVGSFAVWNSGDYGAASGNMTAVDVVKQYQAYLEENAPADMDVVDYDTASSMAATYMDLAAYAGQAATEVAAEDAEGAEEYMLLRSASSSTAARYYQIALDSAPESLNKAGRASLMSQMGYAQFIAGYYDGARTTFEEAYALSATASVVQNYSQFLFSVEGLAAAEELINSYMATITDKGSTEYTNAQSMLEQYRALDAIYGSGLSDGETEPGEEEGQPEDEGTE